MPGEVGRTQGTASLNPTEAWWSNGVDLGSPRELRHGGLRDERYPPRYPEQLKR